VSRRSCKQRCVGNTRVGVRSGDARCFEQVVQWPLDQVRQDRVQGCAEGSASRKSERVASQGTKTRNQARAPRDTPEGRRTALDYVRYGAPDQHLRWRGDRLRAVAETTNRRPLRARHMVLTSAAGGSLSDHKTAKPKIAPIETDRYRRLLLRCSVGCHPSIPLRW
jgi:hypothetical protein